MNLSGNDWNRRGFTWKLDYSRREAASIGRMATWTNKDAHKIGGGGNESMGKKVDDVMCATEQQIWPPLLIVNDVTMSESFSPNKSGREMAPKKYLHNDSINREKESAGWPLSRHSRPHLTYQMYCVMLQRSRTTCRRGKRQFFPPFIFPYR